MPPSLRSSIGAASTALALPTLLLASPGALEAQHEYEVVTVTVTDGATLRGRVVFHGAVPAPQRLLVTKDEEVCGFGYQERHDVIVNDAGGLRDAVVYLEGVREGKAWPAGEGRHTVDQRDCVFRPNMLVMPRLADMEIVNSDPVLHNIHAWELMGDRGRTLFNLGQPPEKTVITQALRPRADNRIRLECDAHDFMQGWIFAADSPYAVGTSTDGVFEIDRVPPGEYTLRVWHPFLGTLEESVSLAEGQTLHLDLELAEAEAREGE